MSDTYERLWAERDALRARAEQAERERDEARAALASTRRAFDPMQWEAVKRRLREAEERGACWGIAAAAAEARHIAEDWSHAPIDARAARAVALDIDDLEAAEVCRRAREDDA